MRNNKNHYPNKKGSGLGSVHLSKYIIAHSTLLLHRYSEDHFDQNSAQLLPFGRASSFVLGYLSYDLISAG